MLSVQVKSGVALLRFFWKYRIFDRRYTMSASTGSSEVNNKSTFRLIDYDCIGFDLDNTILRYKLKNHIQMVYGHLSKYLVEERGYDPNYLYKPIEGDIDFLQKGLVLDFFKGNVIQLGLGGHVKRAAHGTRLLSQENVDKIYGKDDVWDILADFAQNPLHAWNGPVSECIRACLDYFDMPAALAFARCVDSLDAKLGNGNSLQSYNLYSDITSGLVHLFDRNNYQLSKGGYFPDMKSQPELYLHHCSPVVIEWLKELKKRKKLILITGSNVDYASFSAEYCMGKNWQDLFDVLCFFAKKPAFFCDKRPFLAIKDLKEEELIAGAGLKCGSCYSQGNWQDIQALMARETGKPNPKCLYIGDNVIQDIYTPAYYSNCDTVAMSEEMDVVQLEGQSSDQQVIQSKFWGPYFDVHNKKASSLWGNLIERYSKICVPDLQTIAERPLDFQYHSFDSCGLGNETAIGYYPTQPSN